MSKSNMTRHAERELAILARSVPDAIATNFAPEIIALIDAISRNGDSGGSLPYTVGAVADAIKKLAQFRTICPLTGEEDEWANVSEHMPGRDGVWQNKRDSRVFRDGVGARAHFLDAVLFKEPSGSTFFTRSGVKTQAGATVGSSHFIKAFPFKPKTFYIDVVSTEVKPGWWESAVVDDTQLAKVWEYYDRQDWEE